MAFQQELQCQEVLCGLCSPGVVPGPAESASAGNLLEMHVPSPTPDLLNQKFWRWGPASKQSRWF